MAILRFCYADGPCRRVGGADIETPLRTVPIYMPRRDHASAPPPLVASSNTKSTLSQQTPDAAADGLKLPPVIAPRCSAGLPRPRRAVSYVTGRLFDGSFSAADLRPTRRWTCALLRILPMPRARRLRGATPPIGRRFAWPRDAPAARPGRARACWRASPAAAAIFRPGGVFVGARRRRARWREGPNTLLRHATRHDARDDVDLPRATRDAGFRHLQAAWPPHRPRAATHCQRDGARAATPSSGRRARFIRYASCRAAYWCADAGARAGAAALDARSMHRPPPVAVRGFLPTSPAATSARRWFSRQALMPAGRRPPPAAGKRRRRCASMPRRWPRRRSRPACSFSICHAHALVGAEASRAADLRQRRAATARTQSTPGAPHAGHHQRSTPTADAPT